MKFKLALLLLIATSYVLEAQELTTFPGTWGYTFYKDTERITRKEFKSLLAEHPPVLQKWKKAELHTGLSIGLSTSGVILVLVALDEWENRGEINTGLFVGGLALSIGSAVFLGSSMRMRREVILSYNQLLEKKTSLELGAVSNGIGLAYNF